MRRAAISSAAIVLGAAFSVLFIGGGTRFAIGLTLKEVVEELGWGRSELGQAVALFQLVSAACMYGAGRLTDRTSPRLVLGGGLALAGIGIGLMSRLASPWHALVLYGVAFAVGHGAASIIPVGVLVTRAFPRRTGLANAAGISGMSVGQLVMITALAAVLVAIGWRFGARHLGALTGLITMVHHTFGGLGAYLGAAAFDHLGGYGSNMLALALTAGLRRPPGGAPGEPAVDRRAGGRLTSPA